MTSVVIDGASSDVHGPSAVFVGSFSQGPAAGKTVMVVNINPSAADFDETQAGVSFLVDLHGERE